MVRRGAAIAAAILLLLILVPPSVRMMSSVHLPGAVQEQPGRLPGIIARARAHYTIIRAETGTLVLTGGSRQVSVASDNLRKDIVAMDNLYRAAQMVDNAFDTVDVQSQLANVLVQMTDSNAFAQNIQNDGSARDRAADARIVKAYGDILAAVHEAQVVGHGNIALMLFGPAKGFFGAPPIDTKDWRGKAKQFGRATAQTDGGGDFDETAIEDSQHLQTINFYINYNYITGLQSMQDQFASFMAQQIGIIGAFMDSKIQLDTQRDTQAMTADAHKDYEPSTQMCIVGTNARSLAMSDQKGKANAAILNNTMLERDILTKTGMTEGTGASDMTSRKAQYIKNYCEGADNDVMLKPLCGSDTGATPARRNRDIDYEGLVNSPLTLDADFTDATLSNDEEDVLAMSRNLFALDPMPYIPSDALTQGPQTNMGPAAWRFQDLRSLQAIRGVAQNSFAHIVGMKAKGGDQIYPFASQIIKELGVQDADLTKFIGQNPSYFAQMDILTKRLYMAPDFYVNLFTSPANVERMGVTLQAIKLMNDRDRFESSLRREMLISLIVELKIRDAERPIDNRVLGALGNLYVR